MMVITIPKTSKTLDINQLVMLTFVATVFSVLSIVAALVMELHFLAKIIGVFGFLSGCAMCFFIAVDIWKG